MFRNGSCYNVTMLHSCQKFSKVLHLFEKVQHQSKKSEGAFCNTPSLAYQYNEIILLNLTMNLVSFHINGAERTGWTKIFTSTATDTSFCIDHWNLR